MSPTGLQKVLDGAASYSRTRRKLERWYVRETAAYGGTLDSAAVMAALRVLVQDLPPTSREESMELLLRQLEESYAAANRPPPPWVAEARRRLGAG